jgi:hypothetical protein
VWESIPGRSARAVAFGAALALFASAVCGAPAPASAATDAALFCPIRVDVNRVIGHPDETLFTLWTYASAGTATGTLVAYAGGLRYRIPFVAVVAADLRDPKTPPTPIVVRLPAAEDVASAYVAMLNGSDCEIHDPFISGALLGGKFADGNPGEGPYPGWRVAWQAVSKAASQAAPLTVNGETDSPPACAEPYAAAFTRRAVPPSAPFDANPGEVVVVVSISATGALLGERADVIFGNVDKVQQQAALAAAAKAQFAPAVYRCTPVSGLYLYLVDFSFDDPGIVLRRHTFDR